MTRYWDMATDKDHAQIILARGVFFKIYKQALTRKIVFEVVEYDLILKKRIRTAREIVGEKMEQAIDKDIEIGNSNFLRYMVEKFEQRLLFQLGLEELPA